MDNPYASVIQNAATQQNIDPRLLTAVIGTESGFNPQAVNASTDATGLGQQIPATAQSLGIDPRDPVQSINGAARQLSENLRRYGNVDDAVRAYHGGTDQANWGPKTEDYLSKVSSAFRNQSQASAPQAQPSSDPIDQMLAGKTAAPAVATQTAPADPIDAMLASKEQLASPVVPRGTPRSTEDILQGYMTPEERQAAQGAQRDVMESMNKITGLMKYSPTLAGYAHSLETGRQSLATLMGMVGNQLGLVSNADLDAFMRAKEASQQQYEQAREANAPQSVQNLVSGQRAKPGIDWGDIAGSTVLAGSAGKALEALGGAGTAGLEALGYRPMVTVPTRLASGLADVAQNTATGVGAAALSSAGNRGDISSQLAIGGGIGALAPPILTKTVGALASPIARLLQKAAPESAPTAESVSSDIQQAAPSIMSAAQKDVAGNVTGIDKTKLPKHIQDILNSGPIKDLTPEQQNRILNYEALGLRYTFADITRNPADAMVERNLAQNKELGDPIRQTDIAKNTSLLQAAQRAVDMTGEKPLSMYDLGSSIREHLLGQRDAMDAQIGKLYRDADQAAAGAPMVNLNPLVKAMQANRSQYLASQEGTSLVKGIRAQLQEFTGGPPKNPGNAILVDTDGNAMLNAGDIPPKLSFSDSERMRQFLNSVSNQDNYKLIKPLKDAIDVAQDSSASGGIYDQARDLRASRGAQFDNNPAVANILNAKSGNYRVTSENVAKSALGKGADDLQSLITQLQKGGDEGRMIINQLRSTTMQNAVSKSIDKTPNQLGAGNFSGLKFGDQLDAIGQKKMSILFTPEQQNYLGALRRGAIDLTTSPKIPNPYNPSGTTAQHINMLDYLAQNAPPTWLGNAAQKAANVAPSFLSGAGLLVGGLKGAGAGVAAGNVIKSRVAAATEKAAEAATVRQAQAAGKPLEAMTAAQKREAQAAAQAAQRQRLNRLIGQRLQGMSAIGGALQPSNNP